MIDLFAIFTRGGFVLFYESFISLDGRPLDRLIRSVLLEQKAGLGQLSYGNYTVKWTLSNAFNLVFAVVFPRKLPIVYANLLLEQVKDTFCVQFADGLHNEDKLLNIDFYEQFVDTFHQILQRSEEGEAHVIEKNKSANKSTPTKANKTNASEQRNQLAKEEKEKETNRMNMSTDSYGNQATEEDQQERIRRNIEKLKLKPKKLQTKKQSTPVKSAVETTKGKKNTAKLNDRLSKEEAEALDYSKLVHEGDISADKEDERMQVFRSQFIPHHEESDSSSISSDVEEESYDMLDEKTIGSSNNKNRSQRMFSGGVLSFFKTLASKKEITKEDLAPVLEKLRETLVAKNVSSDIAQQLCDSIGVTLEGKTAETFKSISRMVREALETAITRMLTPKQSNDWIVDILNKRRETQEPFVIVFCGVNGVGKSTSLAKVCYYLQSHGLQVLIAACDTFRAGAVEQLRVHARCLNVELYEKGYAKDPASLAAEAIRFAKEKKIDVVLIDTAGRMQDNEPLMKALAKLVSLNHPDRVVFVGEALVGNDAVDQLLKFNRALVDYQNTTKQREIDGIILTKCDSIDDKVGAAVSMVYSTNIPIVFVGVGQTYVDLKKMNVASFVKALVR
eukprot:jgi/Galph1/2558/GphlegSOOS_G1223.1